MSIHPSERLLVCTSKSNRLSAWNVMTCSMIFHFKIKTLITQSKFLGDSYLVLLTENSILLFDLDRAECVDELRLWEDERMARYDRTLRLNDMDVRDLGDSSWQIIVGDEAGNVIVWNVQKLFNKIYDDTLDSENKKIDEREDFKAEDPKEIESKNILASSNVQSSFKIFKIYNSTRVKRNRIITQKNKIFLATISTEGHISVFDLTGKLESGFDSKKDLQIPLGAIIERKMDVRLTQLEIGVLASEMEIKRNMIQMEKMVATKAVESVKKSQGKNLIINKNSKNKKRQKKKNRKKGRKIEKMDKIKKPGFKRKKFKVKVKK